MKLVKPTVRLIASTTVDSEAMESYLLELGVPRNKVNEFFVSEAQDEELLTAFSGKLCYNSFSPGLNPNVTKTRDDKKEYLDNILKVGHGSVLEHASFSFLLTNVSRVLTHEIVRHRAGCAVSQESLRYVRPTELRMWLPSCLESDVYGAAHVEYLVREIEKFYKILEDIYGIEDMKDFDSKKKLTSALRRILPQGMATAMVFTMNLRAARHIIQMRTARSAEEEIRLVFDEIAKILKDRVPLLMQDMLRVEEFDCIGEWTSKYPSNPYDHGKA